jgi:hypothetical protein
MKRKIVLIFCFGLLLNIAFTQNKKEQIESLNFSIDSLNKLVEVKNFEIKDFNLKLEQQSSKIQDKDKII